MHFNTPRYKNMLTTFVLLAGLLAAGAASAQDESAFQPAILENDVALQGQLEDRFTAVLYAFHGSQGDRVSINMNQTDDALDPYLVLFGDAGLALAYDDDSGDDSGGPQYSALISDFELPYDGSYYVLATSYDYIDGMSGTASAPLSRPLAYEIMVSGVTVPSALEGFDPAISTLVATHLQPGNEIDLDLTAEQPTAYVMFSGAAGDTVDVAVRTESMQLAPIIHLFAPDGRRLAMNTVMDGDTSTANLDDIELPVDGLYLFMTMHVFFMDRVGYESSNYGLGRVTAALD